MSDSMRPWGESTDESIQLRNKIIQKKLSRFQDDETPPAEQPANAKQYGGNHYKNKKIEPWDYITANNIGYLDGTAIKYLSRWKEKNGIEDLRKAIHFIEKLIEVEMAAVIENSKLHDDKQPNV